MVELHPDRAPGIVDRQRDVEPAVLDAQVIQLAQGLARKPAQLRVVPLALQLGDDHQGKDHIVLREAAERGRVGQQDRSV